MITDSQKKLAFPLIFCFLFLLFNTLGTYGTDDLKEHSPLLHPALSSSSDEAIFFTRIPLTDEDERKGTSSRPLQAQLPNMTRLYFDPPNEFDISALVIYTPTPTADQGTRLYWDDSSQFMTNMDQVFFWFPTSRKVYIAGIVSGLIGAAFPATPATGSIMWGIGNTLKIPISGAVSNAIVAEIMVTNTIVYARQFYNRGQVMMATICHEMPFSARTEQGSNSPHIYNHTLLHTALKVVIGCGAIFEGAYYWGIVYLAEGKEYRSISLGMGWGLAMAFAERYYTTGLGGLNRLFSRYVYDSALIHQQRQVLMSQADRALLEVERNDSFAREIYQIVQHGKQNTSDQGEDVENYDPQHYFALSALLLRHFTAQDSDHGKVPAVASDLVDDVGVHKDAKIIRRLKKQLKEEAEKINELKTQLKQTEELVEQLQNFKKVTDRLTPSAKEEFMEYLAVLLTGASKFGRLLGRQYILELVLENLLGVDPGTASTTAWCMAGFDIVLRNILEYDTQGKSMKSWLDSFSLKHLIDFQILRKGAGWFSLLNGGWVALSSTIASIKKFQEMAVPLPLQIACVIPGFILDMGYVAHYHEEHLNELITAASTLESQCCGAAGVRQQRAWCHSWIKKLKKFLEEADMETIALLFNKTQRAV